MRGGGGGGGVQLRLGEKVMWFSAITTFVKIFHQTYMSVKVEGGSGLTPDMSHSQPTDVLVRHWAQGKPAAYLTSRKHLFLLLFLAEASQRVGGCF